MFTCKVFGIRQNSDHKTPFVLQTFTGSDSPQRAKKLVDNLTSIAHVCGYEITYWYDREIT